MHEALNPWHFVVAAYGIGLGGTVAMVVQSWLAMKRAEARRDKARGEKAPGNKAPGDKGGKR